MNSPFAQQAAKDFARRAGSVRTALELAYGRRPEEEEVELLEALEKEHGLDSVCLAILNSSEFLYLP